MSGTPGSAANGQATGRLADFLQSQKELFLDDLKAGRGKRWTVAMGNEAGDLDSVASSIAFSYLSSTLTATRSIPLILTLSSLMGLRPENQLALEKAFIPPSVLVHQDTLPCPLPHSGVTYALVDHNSLLPLFIDGEVEAIIDHHDDEHRHMDAAIREIRVPTGSCASLVAKHFMLQWQKAASGPSGLQGSPVAPEIATLLLSAMLIDTAAFKEGGKAQVADYESAAFLYPLSTLASGDTESLSAQSFGASTPAPLTAYAEQLIRTKFDVAHLSTNDLLLRDYKEYNLLTSSLAYPSLRVGLSTVPLGLKEWLQKESQGWTSFVAALDEYMAVRQLDVGGILTTYRSDKGKNRRELMLLVRSGNGIRDEGDARRVLNELAQGVEADPVLDLGKWEKKGFTGGIDALEAEGRWGLVWQQGNTKATRKQVAPLLRGLATKLQ